MGKLVAETEVGVGLTPPYHQYLAVLGDSATWRTTEVGAALVSGHRHEMNRVEHGVACEM
ncbi:hypothetical protein MUK42_33905 [Musa troglodytarum]|uniref:Uncharacterized protein n=1 Tax=Musa troglodytarum TaxID=320322 RepID=A0A9E7JYK3_9LILI|nr:hypothetical protein MUK42_33905 [Musa troglodytarum]